MHRIAFKMQLLAGKKEEYKRRHDALWPELAQLLKASGIQDYSIFLDEETGALFGVLKIRDKEALQTLPQQPVMQKWWAFMSDLMNTNPDQSPVSIPLEEMFYLP